jgi:hypothetical protein
MAQHHSALICVPSNPQRRPVTSGVWDIEAIRNCTHEFEYAPPPPRLSTGTLCPTFPAVGDSPRDEVLVDQRSEGIARSKAH